MRIRVESPDIIPEYLLYYLKTKEGYKAIHECVEGVHLVQGRAKTMKIIKPSLKIQEKIVSAMKNQQDIIEKSNKEITDAKTKQGEIINKIFNE